MSRIGFMGLGAMGLPMAVNIAKAGMELMVYNRTKGRSAEALDAGAKEADSPEALIEWSDIVVMMLSGPPAVEASLGRALMKRPELFKGKLVANMGTNPPSYSKELAGRLDSAGAVFVDAPVSGTLEPAVKGELLIMASGPEQSMARLEPVFSAVGSKAVYCGEAPKAGMMKLAVNLVLSASLEGLIEGAHFAKKAGLDLESFFGLIMAGPLACGIFGLKSQKLLQEDYAPQASLNTVLEMLKAITDTAHEIKACVPNTLSNLYLTTAAVNKGLGDEDACALIKVFE